MKIKKILTLGCILPLLASCAKKSIAGTYVFQMGKEKGTHFGLFLNLTDDEYVNEAHPEVTGYKKLTLSLNVSFSQSGSEETQESFDSFLDVFKDENGNFSLDGYYKLLDEKNKQNENRLSIGLGFEYIFDFFLDAYKSSTESDLPDDKKEQLDKLNNNDLIQSIIYATYLKTDINFYVPVSADDAYYQLYWYGYDIQINEETYEMNIVNTPKHEFGSSPTKEEVAAINENFASEHAGMTYTSYRSFNVLKLTLMKK